MKKWAICIGLLSGVSNIKGQERDPFRLRDVQLGLYNALAASKTNSYLLAGLSMHYQRHTLITGLGHNTAFITYRVNPFHEYKILNVYLQFHTQFSTGKELRDVKLYKDYNAIYSYADVKDRNLYNIIGYGLKLQLFKGLHLSQAVGLGFCRVKRSYLFHHPDLYYKPPVVWNLSSFFQLGLGYTFPSRPPVAIVD